MKEDVEGRWKKDDEKIPRRSHSLPSSFQVNISDSGSAENSVPNPKGVLMLIGQHMQIGRVIPPRHLFHRGEANHFDGSLRPRQSKDSCLNSQEKWSQTDI